MMNLMKRMPLYLNSMFVVKEGVHVLKEIELEAHAVKGRGKTMRSGHLLPLLGIGCSVRLCCCKKLKMKRQKNYSRNFLLKCLTLKILVKVEKEQQLQDLDVVLFVGNASEEMIGISLWHCDV